MTCPGSFESNSTTSSTKWIFTTWQPHIPTSTRSNGDGWEHKYVQNIMSWQLWNERKLSCQGQVILCLPGPKSCLHNGFTLQNALKIILKLINPLILLRGLSLKLSDVLIFLFLLLLKHLCLASNSILISLLMKHYSMTLITLKVTELCSCTEQLPKKYQKKGVTKMCHKVLFSHPASLST